MPYSPKYAHCSYSFCVQVAAFPVKSYSYADIRTVFADIKKHWPDSEIRVTVWNAAHNIRKGFLDLTEEEVQESVRTSSEKLKYKAQR